MVAIRHKGRPDARPLDVPEESLEKWAAVGYVPVDDPSGDKPKATRRRRGASKTDSDSE